MNTSSRRAFIKNSSKAGMAAVLLASGAKGFYPLLEEDNRIIDIHQHTNYSDRSDEDLLKHQRTMGITASILLPAGHPISYGSTHYGISNGLLAKVTPNEAAYAFAQKYPGEFFFAANEVPDVPNAHDEIEKYLKLGAKMIAELKFNLECDSAPMKRIYELAEAYKVPVLMHWQYEMYNRHFERFHKILKKYKNVTFIGHAQTWWANIDKNHSNQNTLYPKGKVTPGGMTDKLLADYPNVYGDLSAGSGLNALTRDEDFTRDFLKRHQDKLLYGSDCNDHDGKGNTCQGAQTIAAVKRLAPDKKIERKLLFDNANSLLRMGL